MFTNEQRNLMFDLANGREIYDEEQSRVIDSKEANDVLRKFVFEKLGITKKSSTRDINRALKRDSAHEFFQIIEEILDEKISTGWEGNEFFNDYVETKNIADGDDNEFYVEDDIILEVSKVSGDNHDLIMQKFGDGEVFSVPMSVYAVKVGTDIRLFLTGKRDWGKFIDGVARAFQSKIMDEIYTQFAAAGSKIAPTSQFNKTGTIVKDTLDTLIEDVSTANGGCDVVIVGTRTALKKLNAVTDVDWRSDSQKESVANTGILGNYEGTALMAVSQRFKANDTTTKLISNTTLHIMPMVDNKFVKFVDRGETEIEITEKGETMNDMQSYEIQRPMGVGVVITKYFGTYTGI